MRVRVEVRAAGGDAPPPGSSVLVQVQDTAYQDTAATIMAETRGQTTTGDVVAIAELDVSEQPGAHPTIYVHIDVDGDGAISEGDYITMQSYPCRGGDIKVEVRKV